MNHLKKQVLFTITRICYKILAGITEISENGFDKKKIYGVPNGYFIWSNLNRAVDNLVFLNTIL